MIDAILFDFGQTLVDSAAGFRAAERDAQQKLHAELGGVSWDAFIECYRHTRKTLQDQSHMSRVALWRQVFACFDRAPDSKRLVAWEREYWQTVNDHTGAFPEATRVLERLRQDYRLAIISNTQGQAGSEDHRLREFPEIVRHFEVIIISGQGGIPAKPDPEPFRLCLQQLDIAADAAVYIGDDYRIDVGGARAAGIRPLWLKHHTVARNWPAGDKEVPVITSLEPLLDLALLLANNKIVPDAAVTGT